MATNDGTRLEVFGLSFREHHTLHMQQILRQYHKLPAAISGPPNRAVLFTGLFDLANELDEDQTQHIRDWLKNGGEFPAPVIAPVVVPDVVNEPVTTGDENNDETQSKNGVENGDSDETGEDEGEWPEYNPDDFRDIDEVDSPEEELEPRDDAFLPVTDQLSTPQEESFNPDRRGSYGKRGRTLSADMPAFDQDGDINPGYRQRGGGLDHYRGADLSHGFGHGFGPGRTLSGAAPVDMAEDFTPSIRNENSVRGGGGLAAARAPFLDDDEVNDELPDEYIARYSGAYQGRGHTISGIASSTPSEDATWGSNQRDPPRGHTLFPPVNDGGIGEVLDVLDSNDRSHISVELDPSDLECRICAESLPASAFPPNRKITKNCEEHDYQACYPCIEHSIQSTLDEGSIHRLNCLFCHQKMSHEDIKKYATKSAFARYEYLLLLDSPDIVMCLSPTCNAGQKHNDKDNPKMVCNTCSYETCVLHKLPWHGGITCAEFDISEEQIDRLDAAEATAKLLAKEHSKVCPNCHQGVFRTDGCDHLLCRCGKEWCFLCLASWENIMRIGPTAHAVTCDNHPHKVRATAAQVERNRNALSTLAFGGQASAELLAARDARNRRIIADARARSLAAAEKRLAEQKEAASKEGSTKVTRESPAKKRKVNLKPAWEEGGLTKKAF